MAAGLALHTCIITGGLAFPECKKSRFRQNGLVLGTMGIDIATCSTTAVLAHCDSPRLSKKLIASIYDKESQVIGMDMNINWGLIWPLIALQFVLMVTALISLYKVETANLRGPKWMWVLIIVLLNIVGSIAYFVAGRKEV